ncbi:hypothetical protein [Vibrio parahaemolyticus]|uniref:hypothetical protein n=1 Tax=Vibrio parahaemolyticus TaxID=670 RepID=UPI003298C637
MDNRAKLPVSTEFLTRLTVMYPECKSVTAALAHHLSLTTAPTECNGEAHDTRPVSTNKECIKQR